MTTKTTNRLTAAAKDVLRTYAALADNVRAARATLDAAERALTAAEPAALEILRQSGPQILDRP